MESDPPEEREYLVGDLDENDMLPEPDNMPMYLDSLDEAMLQSAVVSVEEASDFVPGNADY